jgi:hypothetical protein
MAFSLRTVKDDANAVRIEDDGRVCYAYFHDEKGVDGFVWLYNIDQAPSTLEEQRGIEAPLNPQTYVRATAYTPPNSEDEFDFNWVFREGVWECGIYIRNRLHAVLGKGDRPGWCVLAGQDGPVAQRLEWAER